MSGALALVSLCGVVVAAAPIPAVGSNPTWDAEFPITGRTYYVAPSGSDGGSGSRESPLATIRHAAQRVGPGDGVIVLPGTYRERVDITCSGRDGAWIVFRAEPGVVVEEGSSPLWPELWNGILTLQGASHVVVSGFVVQNSHWFGISVFDSDHVVVQNNRTYNTGASGILAWGGSDIVVRGNVVQRACYQTRDVIGDVGTQECISVARLDGFEIYANEVFESGAFGEDATGGEGIDAKDSSRRGRIYANRVHDLDRLGVYLDAWDGVLEDVDVFSNAVWNCRTGYAVSSENGGTARRIRLYNNLAWSNVAQGVIVSSWGVNGPREELLIVNNTLVGNGGPEWGGGILVQSTNVRDIAVRNNLCSRNAQWQIAVSEPGLVEVGFNLIDGFRGLDWTGEVRGDAFVEAEPLLVGRETGDFHLQGASPAIDAGHDRDAPAIDYDGLDRPQGNSVDIGAFEYPYP